MPAAAGRLPAGCSVMGTDRWNAAQPQRRLLLGSKQCVRSSRHPWYRVSTVLKECTAIVSWVTVLALIPVHPKALHLPAWPLRTSVWRPGSPNASKWLEFTNNILAKEGMIELKEEVNALLEELGRQPRYTVDL